MTNIAMSIPSHGANMGDFGTWPLMTENSDPEKHKASPVLIPDGFSDTKRIHAAFLEISRTLPNEVANYVLQALERHPKSHAET